jgi:hypothetical protein
LTANSTLLREFKKNIKGECFFDPVSRWLYSTDASIYQIEPLGVIIPQDADDVVTSLEIASKQGISLIARGGGTSLPDRVSERALSWMSLKISMKFWKSMLLRSGRGYKLVFC